jgi:hypothetical protein
MVKDADVAQLVEQPIRNRQVSGSSPLVGSSLFKELNNQFTETCCTNAARAIFLGAPVGCTGESETEYNKRFGQL